MHVMKQYVLTYVRIKFVESSSHFMWQLSPTCYSLRYTYLNIYILIHIIVDIERDEDWLFLYTQFTYVCK